jgi:hypothetical protein
MIADTNNHNGSGLQALSLIIILHSATCDALLLSISCLQRMIFSAILFFRLKPEAFELTNIHSIIFIQRHLFTNPVILFCSAGKKCL